MIGELRNAAPTSFLTPFEATKCDDIIVRKRHTFCNSGTIDICAIGAIAIDNVELKIARQHVFGAVDDGMHLRDHPCLQRGVQANVTGRSIATNNRFVLREQKA